MGAWWIAGFACGGLLLLVLGILIFLAVKDYKSKQRIIAEGEHTVGWLVQANWNLFEKGVMDLPALVLISPDDETNDDREFMTDLADVIMDVKGYDPDDCDGDDALIAELMADETYVAGKRDKLPASY